MRLLHLIKLYFLLDFILDLNEFRVHHNRPLVPIQTPVNLVLIILQLALYFNSQLQSILKRQLGRQRFFLSTHHNSTLLCLQLLSLVVLNRFG